MAFSRFFRVVSRVFLWSVVLQTAGAQQAESPEQDTVAVSISAETPVEHLQILLRPMTLGELEAEVHVWQERLKTKATAIARKEIAVKNLNGDQDKVEAKEELLDQLNQLREQKAVLLQQFDAVVDAYEAKGGDVVEPRKYAAALSGLSLDATDAVTFWTTLSGWVSSREGGLRWLIGISQFVVIMLVAWLLSKLLGNVVRRALAVRHIRISGLLRRFINNMVRRVVLLIGLMIALATIGVNVGALVALIGGGAFVLGFALQDTLSNFANGIMLFIYRPFDVGDAVDIGGVSGSVEAVSLVSTTIRSWDNKVILVPNKEVWGKVITNMTGTDERRVDMVFGIGYSDDIDKARSILERLVKDHPLTLEDPAPTIRVNELADSSVNFVVRPWSKTSDYWSVYWDLTEQVKKAFDAEGVSIPFPQQDVHLHQQGTASS